MRQHGADKLGDILARILPRDASRVRLGRRWQEITSEVEQRWSEVTALRATTLHVLVRNSALFQELRTYRRVELITEWNRRGGPKITAIKFKVV